MVKKMRLGEELIERGLVSASQIEEAVRIQVGGNRRLGYILIKMGLISDDQLLEVLAGQFELPIINIAEEFSSAVKHLLPRYLCRKYTVIPIARSENNILTVAMIDPSDEAAIDDIESYTGLVVKPLLAREKEISAAISALIPHSLRDIFNPRNFTRLSQLLSFIALLLLLITGVFGYRHLQAEKYGEATTVGTARTFKNHDLMVGVEENGNLSLLGHGAYANGFYSITFDSTQAMTAFIEQKRKKFSDQQYQWLLWVIDHRINSPD